MSTVSPRLEPVTNAMTVDVEDYFQVAAFEHCIRREDWPRWPVRVEGNTRRVLELFERHGVHATFFVLSWVAERFPALVRDIRAADTSASIGAVLVVNDGSGPEFHGAFDALRGIPGVG